MKIVILPCVPNSEKEKWSTTGGYQGYSHIQIRSQLKLAHQTL